MLIFSIVCGPIMNWCLLVTLNVLRAALSLGFKSFNFFFYFFFSYCILVIDFLLSHDKYFFPGQELDPCIASELNTINVVCHIFMTKKKASHS